MGSAGVKVGVCSFWFNRGQATVGRYLRDALEALGHETYVLARPTPDRFVRRRFVDRAGVWDQPRVTELTRFDAEASEYVTWARESGCEVVFFDQNYQFEAMSALRADGVRTIGRFVWESFGAQHVDGARRALDVVYSLTRAEQERYRGFGMDTPFVPFGCHPELLRVPVTRPAAGTTFFYPGGYLSQRKPTGAVLDAFRATDGDDLRLVIKAQRPLWRADLARPRSLEEVDRRVPFLQRRRADVDAITRGDPRIEVVTDDLGLGEYYELFASCHACVGVSRWEGLGLHLWEAIAFGMPIVATKMAPVDEVAVDGENAILVPSRVLGHRQSGVEVHEPDVGALRDAMVEVRDPGRRSELEAGARRQRERRQWQETVAAVRDLLAQ
jgi:glycosyltransferase involved in cell wall biosynthesis